jgi:poly-gamma-glutamate synthase PgsB/CapB
MGACGAFEGYRRQPIRELVTTAICLAAVCVLLYFERRAVERDVKRLAVRVAVTGTRGKSTVTRLIAAGLREAGSAVLAKTTGSKAVLILPDGREEEVVRRGLPSILEQKKILRRAASLGVRAMVTEMMSIQPQFLKAESLYFLQPQYLVISNVRIDHREEMGRTKPEIAQSLAQAIRPGMTIFLPRSERHDEFASAAARNGARIIAVESQAGGSFIEEDRSLAEAVVSHLGVPQAVARRGIAQAAADYGSVRVWQAELGRPPASWTLVSAFAANEPESSALILDHLREKNLPAGRPLVGLLNFRADRGDRTRQWLDAHDQGFFSSFQRVYLVGAHIHALKTRRRRSGVPPIVPLPAREPKAIMARIVSAEGGGGVLVGFGNIGGLGMDLIEHWEEVGRPYAP